MSMSKTTGPGAQVSARTTRTRCSVSPAKGRISISRMRSFRTAERTAFLRPIQGFWQRWSSAPFNPNLADVITAERTAILAVGQERDLGDINTSRRKALEFLGKTGRHDYGDLLLTIANISFIEAGEANLTTAQGILEQILLVEQQNWHALILLAMVEGAQGRYEAALSRFETAKSALSTYAFEVLDVELWEAMVFEARFRVAAATAENPAIAQEELFAILEPAFQDSARFCSDERGEAFYTSAVRDICRDLLQNRVPLPTIAYVFAKPVSGESEPIFFDSIGATPLRLAAAMLPIREEFKASQPVSAAFRAAGSALGEAGRGLTKRAGAFYAVFAVLEILDEKNTRAKKPAEALLRRLEKEGFVAKPALAELRRSLRTTLQRRRAAAVIERQAAARVTRQSVLDAAFAAIKSGSVSSGVQQEGIVKTLSDAWERETEKDTLMALIADAICEGVSNASGTQLVALVLIADACWKMDAMLQPGLRDAFANSLKEEAVRIKVRRLLKETWGSMLVTAQAVIDGKHPQMSVRRPEYPGSGDFAWMERTHDFFFVRLGELEAVRGLFREIAAPYAKPVSLRSSWFGMLAERAPSIPQQVKFYRRSLKLGPANVMSRLELVRVFARAGRMMEFDKLIKSLLVDSSGDLLWLKAACISTENLRRRVGAMVGDNVSPERLRSKQEEAKVLLAQTEDRLTALEAGLLHLDDDWKAALYDLGHIFSLLHDFGPAMKAYQLLIDRLPTDHMAVQAQGFLLFKLGMFHRAVALFSGSYTQSQGQQIIFLQYIADALYYTGDYEKALEFADFALRERHQYVGFLFVKARALVMLGQVQKAEAMVARAAKWYVDTDNALKDYPVQFRNVKANRLRVKADILWARGEHKQAVADYQKAIELFSRDFASEFGEIATRWRLARSLSERGIKEQDVAILEQGLGEARVLVERFPFFCHGYEVIAAPLISLGRQEEALGYLQRLVDNSEGVSDVALANLIQIGFSENQVGQQARGLVRSLAIQARERDQTDNFGEQIRRAKDLVVRYYTDGNDGCLNRVDE